MAQKKYSDIVKSIAVLDAADLILGVDTSDTSESTQGSTAIIPPDIMKNYVQADYSVNLKTLTLPASTVISTLGSSLVANTTSSGMRTILGTVIGTDVQAHSAALDLVSGTNTGDQPTTENIIIAVGDESTGITVGTAKVTFRMPYAMTLSAIKASVTIAPVGASLTVDVNKAGTSIMTTNKLVIETAETSTKTATTQPTLTTTSFADDDEITIDVDTIGSTTAGAGLKVTLIGAIV